MFSKAKVNDRVWSFQYGWGTIVEVNVDEIAFLPDISPGNYYWVDKKTGKYHPNDINPAIYWQEFKIPPEAFKKSMPIDTKVIVWDMDKNYKYKRHFSHFKNDGKIYCFQDGATSWSSDGSVTGWTNWELAEEENNEE